MQSNAPSAMATALSSSQRRLLLLIFMALATITVLEITQLSSEEALIKEEDVFGRVSQENLRRLEQMRKTCLRHRHETWTKKPIWKRWLAASQKHRLVMCRHAKAGSTTWLWHFLRLSSHLGPKSDNISVFKVHSMWSKYLGLEAFGAKFRHDVMQHKDVFAFSFVRHPFERLASAFEDKILAKRDPSYINLATKLQAQQAQSNRSLFEHFLMHVLNTGNDNDVHWRAFYHTCAYCSYIFDFIGKQETFMEDAAYVFHSRGMDPDSVKVLSKVHWHPGTNHASAKSLFDSVSNKVKIQISKMYQIDFEMFNYSMEGYV